MILHTVFHNQKFIRDGFYYILIPVLLFLCVLMVIGFRYGFWTSFDQSYFLLKLQEAYDGTCITGKSQWNYIAIHLFPWMDLTDKVNSYIASNILNWITIVVFSITAVILNGKERIAQYIGLFFLTYFFAGNAGLGLSYVPMQTFAICLALCSSLLMLHSENFKLKCIFIFITGLFLGMGCFIIAPSALAVTALIATSVVLIERKNITHIATFAGFGFLGTLAYVLYFHLFICNLEDVIREMHFTASYIGKADLGYDYRSFLFSYAFFCRDIIFVILTYTGAYLFSTKINNNIIGTVLYVLLSLVYLHYQIKFPGRLQVSTGMYLTSVALLPIIFEKWILHQRKEHLLCEENIIDILLLIFPIFASLGTNTSIAGRMVLFSGSWLLLLFKNQKKYPSSGYCRIIVVAIIVLIIPIRGFVDDFIKQDNSYHFVRGSGKLANIAITQRQKEWLDNTYDIMLNNGFVQDSSSLLVTENDYTALYAFGAVNAANFHQVNNFKFWPEERMLSPDFIILCEHDSLIVEKRLRQLPYGWPDNYDRYYVGTPEDTLCGLWFARPSINSRYLYCKKKETL